jgi:small subunit ribosomal protein S3Ae
VIALLAKKTKGKEWITIVAPKLFGEKDIGKTLVSNPEGLLNKALSLSAIDLIDDIGKYHLKFKFRIVKIEGNRAITEFEGSECMQDYISRMVLRRIRRIDSIQDLKTKDGILTRVKVLATISKKATSTVEKAVRIFIHQLVKAEVEKSTLEQFMKKFISNEFKNKVLKESRKIYPIRNFEVRKIEIIRK